MDVHNFFLTLFLILVCARIFGELFERIGIPSVLGELSAGLVLGVSGLGLVEVGDILKVLAEIGIILLLFEVGLETDVNRLKEAGPKATIVALFGIIFPFASAFFLGYYVFALDAYIALFIGGTLTATSIGITLRVLRDIHKEQTNIAQIVIGAAVIDDIIGVILLVFVYDFAMSQSFELMNTLKTMLFVGAFLLIAPPAANIISSAFKKFEHLTKVSGFIPTAIIALILLLSYLSHLMGAPEILGSFMAGIALSRRFFLPFGLGLQKGQVFIQKIKISMRPIIELFTPIFFVVVGLSVNLRVLPLNSPDFWLMAGAFLLIAVVGKYLGAFFITQKCRMNNMLIGISMIPRGEVGLIFAEVGRVNGILNNEIYAVLLLVIIATTIFPPFLLKHLFKFECA